MGVSLKKKKKIFFFFFFFFRETHFHSVITQMQAVVILSDNILSLLPNCPAGRSQFSLKFWTSLVPEDAILNGERESELCEGEIEKSVPQDEPLSSLSKPRDAKR